MYAPVQGTEGPYAAHPSAHPRAGRSASGNPASRTRASSRTRWIASSGVAAEYRAKQSGSSRSSDA
ncbi:hypothetical protein ACN24K_10090 [Streptomyces microflavus]